MRQEAAAFTRAVHHEMGLWGCEVRFRFPTVKLLDFRERLAELEANRNPVAALVLAHLAAQQTRADPTAGSKKCWQSRAACTASAIHLNRCAWPSASWIGTYVGILFLATGINFAQ